MAMRWSDDEELYGIVRRELFTAVVGDILDTHDLTHQFLPADIRPLDPQMTIIGRAMPVLVADVFERESSSDHSATLKTAFGLMLSALDDLQPGEVYLASGGSPGYALWGEIMSTRAIHLRSAGAVLNGYSRDTRGILRLAFPTFSKGAYAQDISPRGKVVDYRVTVEVGGVKVRPGDIVFGDVDGIVVVPCEVEESVFAAAIEKARTENLCRQAIQEGWSAQQAFKHFRVM